MSKIKPQIQIKSKHEPYRRCGMNHTRAGIVHAADSFTAKQLEQLRADPHLVVTDAGPLAGASEANPIHAQVVLSETVVDVQVVGVAADGSPVVSDAAAIEQVIAADKAAVSAAPAKAPKVAKAAKTTKAAKAAK